MLFMDVHVTLEGRSRLSAEVYEQLRAAILDGRLRPGDSVPATRDLAQQLDVSRNTVTNAYQRLMAEGFIAGHAGAGTFVTSEGARTSRRAPSRSALRPRAIWNALVPSDADAFDAEYDFQVGVPDVRLFPWDEWRRQLARQLRPARRGTGGYMDPAGNTKLREAIARHVGISRSVHADAENVVVTSGAQQAIDLIARLLIEPGTCIAMEDPGYHQARRLFQSLGARIVPVPVDHDGLDVSALPSEARLVYVTPSHQHPLGVAMSLSRRMALLAWAEKHGAAILEDDYDSEFRYDGRPLEPLQSLDRSGRVLYVGSFSKTLLPTLRIGFVIAPESLTAGLRAAKLVTDWHCPFETQAALAQFIDDGLFARHVRRLRRVYQERRDRITTALDKRLRDELELLPASAGLHMSVFFRDQRRTTEAFMRHARAASLSVQRLDMYYQLKPRAGVALGWGMIPTNKIEEGIRRFEAVMKRL